MKVDNPQFFNGGSYLEGCEHCPFADGEGGIPNEKLELLCFQWERTAQCPNTPEEYAEACALADAAAKEGE